MRFLLLASTSAIGPESLPDSRSQTSQKGCHYFPYLCIAGKYGSQVIIMTIMIIQFVKDEGLPVVVWPPAHAVTIQKEDLGE